MLPNKVFILYACCIPVRGARRSVLCDLQRQSYRLIPNGLYEILTEHKGKSPAALEEVYGSDSRTIIDEYFRFLEDNEFGFWSDTPDSFPPLELTWDRPERVANAIIDVDANSGHDYSSLLRQLDALGCPALLYRFYSSVTQDALEQALEPTAKSRLRSIDLLLPYHPMWNAKGLEILCFRHQRLSQIYVHSAPEESTIRVRGIGTRILYHPQIVESSAHCGFVHPRYFATTLEAFTEAQSHNSCLNRKISVDTAGNIKNCPAMARSYGHVTSTRLSDAIGRPEFRELWGVTKDQIEVCRECEFRYICTDCRALLVNPADRLSKPLRCGYDPFSATWKTTEDPVTVRSI